ncbi:MAG: TM2 domain-containing protein [Rhodothermales bacterium]|nr:TM2 domain-containing protein [Rhodothermales bacterium]
MSDIVKRTLEIMPEIEDEELLHVSSLLKSMTEDQAKQFALVYKKRRKDPGVALILAAVGFLGFNGIHRLYLDQIGMGVLYLFTFGLCLIGTIVDMFNHQSLALEYNKRRADDVAVMIRTLIEDSEPPALPPA